jgi:hypothetical protein
MLRLARRRAELPTLHRNAKTSRINAARPHELCVTLNAGGGNDGITLLHRIQTRSWCSAERRQTAAVRTTMAVIPMTIAAFHFKYHTTVRSLRQIHFRVDTCA